MNRMPYLRRWIAGFCLAALLFAAVTYAGIGLLVAILTPLLLFLAIIITAPILVTEKRRDLCPFPVLPVFSPRPPPVR